MIKKFITIPKYGAGTENLKTQLRGRGYTLYGWDEKTLTYKLAE